MPDVIITVEDTQADPEVWENVKNWLVQNEIEPTWIKSVRTKDNTITVERYRTEDDKATWPLTIDVETYPQTSEPPHIPPRNLRDPDDHLHFFEDISGEWRWHRLAANNEVISSGEGHTREADAKRAAYRANPDLAPKSYAVEDDKED